MERGDKIMSAKPRVFVIILNWNGKDYLNDCLPTISNQTYPNYKVVLVDNGSTDDSVEFVKKNYPHVAIIELDRNYGFSKGNNIGIEYALKKGADYVLLLNNDTVVKENFLEELVLVAENNNAGICGPKIFFWNLNGRNDIIWFAGGYANVDKGKFYHYRIGKPDIKKEEISEVDFISGCCMLIKKDVFKKIGLLDEVYSPVYCEDIDFCLRAKKAGFKILYNPKAVVWHKVSATSKGAFSSRKAYFKYRNTIILIRKHGRLTLRTLMNVLIDAVLYSHGSFKTDKRDFLYTPFKILKGILDGIKMELKRL